MEKQKNDPMEDLSSGPIPRHNQQEIKVWLVQQFRLMESGLNSDTHVVAENATPATLRAITLILRALGMVLTGTALLLVATAEPPDTTSESNLSPNNSPDDSYKQKEPVKYDTV